MPSKWGTNTLLCCTESCAKEAEAVDNAVTVRFYFIDELRDDGTETLTLMKMQMVLTSKSHFS